MRQVTACVSTALLCLLSATALHAQQPPSSVVTSVPPLVRVTSAFVPANGLPAAPVETVTLAIYAEETGGTPLWQETQDVAVDADGRYTVLLGATLTDGLPLDLFASGDARWLGRRFERPGEGEQARVRLASVPYALKASDADTLGGRPPSAYLLAEPGASAGAGATSAGAADKAKTSFGSVVGPLTAGTTGFVGKFVTPVDLGNSAIYDAGGLVGVNTTTPFDAMHVRFTNTGGQLTGLAVQNLGSTATSYSGMLFYDQNGALGQFQGFNNSTHEYRINNVASGGSINFMLGSTSKFKADLNGVRIPGMTRLGSETGTPEAPGGGIAYTGLVVRRINTTNTVAGTVVARTNVMTLERDGTFGGFRITSTAFMDVACMGVNSSGVSVNRVLNLSAGVTALYTDATAMVFFHCSFGDPFGLGHLTEVSLSRSPGDYFWIGTVTSTFNQ